MLRDMEKYPTQKGGKDKHNRFLLKKQSTLQKAEIKWWVMVVSPYAHFQHTFK